jgi:peptidoglycan/xylan/chitin deacetylase (PgdA/CDA1 family)
MNLWPDHYGAAVSLTFDDGLGSQLSIAVPRLNERGLKATFYLNPRGKEDHPGLSMGWRERLEAWLPVQQAGHEIGNHSLNHPCSLNIDIDWQEDDNLLGWTLERIEQDLDTAQQRLRSVFPDQTHTSFAYPCYESTLGRGLERVSYTPVVARRFVAARGRGELSGSLANDPLWCDLHYLSSWAVERQAGALMIGLVELALAAGSWGIITFHGIQEGHLPVGDTDFVELLDHLVRRRDVVWVVPVAQVAAHLQDVQARV